MASIYIETSVVSYLTARPSASLVAAAHQQITREWWDRRRLRFDPFISPLVLEEAGRGDPEAAARRLAALEGFAVLEATDCAMRGYICPEICTPEELMGRGTYEG